MNEYIDEAIASVADTSRPEADNAEIENDNLNTESGEESGEGQPEDGAAQQDDQPFPKKAVNALEKRNRRINQLSAVNRQQQEYIQKMEQRLSALENGYKAGTNPQAPREEDFDNYKDFLKAEMKFELQQADAEKQQATQQQQQQQVQAQQYQQWKNTRADAIDAQAEQVAKQVPELVQLYEDNADIVEAFSPAVQHAFMESEPQDAILAFLALAQEGRLEQLAQLPYQRAVVEIGRAADRGAAILKARTTSKAPRPMSQSRGSGLVSKSVDNMTPDELLDLVRK